MINNLSIAHCKGTLSACECQTVIKINILDIKSVKSDLEFDPFWKYIEKSSSEISVS